MAKIEKKSNTPATPKKSITGFDFAFGKINYILLIAGVVVLILGFLLLVGGGSDDPAVFSDKIFDTRRLVVAPILLVLGFVIEIFAIMVKAKD